MVKELRQILQRFVSKSTLLTSKPAVEINGESQQFEQIARAALLPRCFRTGELSLGALDPDFPIDAMRPERQMLRGRTLGRVGAHYHRTGETLSKHGVRITEEDVGRGEVNPGLFLNEGSIASIVPGALETE